MPEEYGQGSTAHPRQVHLNQRTAVPTRLPQLFDQGHSGDDGFRSPLYPLRVATSHRRLTTKWMWADMSVIDCSMAKISDQLLITHDMKMRGIYFIENDDPAKYKVWADAQASNKCEVQCQSGIRLGDGRW